MNSRKIKVIYISGIGRSGSTLLDMIISSSPQVFSVGEVYKLNEMIDDNVLCSCGKDVEKCDFWSFFLKTKITIFNRIFFLNYFRIILFLLNPFRREKFNFKDHSDNFKFFSSVKNLSKVDFILDSSKEVGRLIELNQDENIDLYNINIIRDGRAVANSFNSKTQSDGKNFIVSLFKWVLANLLIVRYIKIGKVRSLAISYNEFCLNPLIHINRIEKFLGIKIPKNFLEVIRQDDSYHNIGGNRLALLENRRKLYKIKIDEKWKKDQFFLNKFLANLITYFFNKKWVLNKKEYE